jgi:hypothetical protein
VKALTQSDDAVVRAHSNQSRGRRSSLFKHSSSQPVIISRADAKAAGFTRFYTNVACRNGHTAERLVYNGECVECTRAKKARNRKRNPETQRAKRARNCKNNPETKRARERRNHKRNPETNRARKKRNIKRNRETYNAHRRRNRARHPEVSRARVIRWAKEHPEARRAIAINRRARERGAEGHHTAADIQRIFEQQHGICPYGCGADLSLGYHVDHTVPLIKGGSNWPENLQLLCGSCNSSKGGKTMTEWRRRLACVGGGQSLTALQSISSLEALHALDQTRPV